MKKKILLFVGVLRLVAEAERLGTRSTGLVVEGELKESLRVDKTAEISD